MKLSDPYNTSELRARSTAVAILYSILLGLLLLRLWYLQIWRGEEYRIFSDRNRFKVERLSAPRGPLLDRKGRLIADNRARFDLAVIRGNIPNLDYELNILKDVLKWSDQELAQKKERLLKASPYQPQTISEDLTRDELALLESQNLDLEGIDVQVNSVRDYLFKDGFFHSIGYTREIDDEDLKRVQEKFPERLYKRGDQFGVKGVEALYEQILRGHDGSDFIVVDARGRRVNQNQWRLLPKTAREDPIAGTGLMMSFDLDLQMETAHALEGVRGAAIAIDPQTGHILAMVSKPGLDPNVFAGVVKGDQMVQWLEREDKPFLDRTLGEHYAPGSTFKIAIAAAALEQNVIDKNTTYFCPGYYRFGNRVWKCWNKEGHGRVNIVQAIERSCDVFFYNVGLLLGLDPIYTWASRFGFGRRSFLGSEVFPGKLDSIFRFNTEQPGFIPNSDWVLSRRASSVEAEILNSSIGQGAVTTTIMQLARMVAAVGNNGKILQPQLVISTLSSDGKPLQSFESRVENEIIFKPKTLELIREGMTNVIEGALGTARASKIPGLHFGGKTGTAQVAALDLTKKIRAKHLQDNALFVGLAPIENPQIAVAVIVENGGQGSSVAAPIGKRMIATYMKDFIEKEKNRAR